MKGMFVCFSVVFFCMRLTTASDIFTLNCVKSVIMGKYGSSVFLPCWLTPKIDAENLEIRWYRPDQFKRPILMYQNHKIITEFQEMYRNRSSLISSSPQTNGLKEGDVSLRLDNLGLSDIGIFHCYVSGDKSYDVKMVTLNLTALGSPLQISLEHYQNSVKLSSVSCGWFPQPNLLWKYTNAPSDLPSTNYTKQENGLFCIYSRIILSSSDANAINCSVTVSEEETRTVNVYLTARLLVDDCVLWKVLFAVVLLLFILALISYSRFVYRKYKGYVVVKKSDEQPHQSKETIRFDTSKLTIRFDTSKCKKDYLLFSNDLVRDAIEAADKYPRDCFPYELCVSGRETLRSGRVFWEVGLKQHNVPPKKSWLVGVAKASYTLSDKKSDLTPVNGFWFLCSDPQNGLYVNTEPEISLRLNKSLESVGVLLDFDKQELSFYNATDDVHLFTMIIEFKEDVVPLFNPGLGDVAPLQIMNPKVETQNELKELSSSH